MSVAAAVTAGFAEIACIGIENAADNTVTRARIEQLQPLQQFECQDSHIFRLNRKECNTEAGMLYLNTITDFERVGDHAINIAFLARSK